MKHALNVVKWFAPTGTPTRDTPVLVSIAFSHYCEKSRWALDISPQKYKEELHSPALHIATTLLQLAGWPRTKGWKDDARFETSVDSRSDETTRRRKDKTGVPKLLVLDKDTHMPAVLSHGSSGILKYLDDKYPAEMSMYRQDNRQDDVPGHGAPGHGQDNEEDAVLQLEVLQLEEYLEV